MSKLGNFVVRLKSVPPGEMCQVFIGPEHVSPTANGLGEYAIAGEHYFTVRLKALHLETGRSWFSEHLPLLTTAAEFIYGTAQTALPSVVGPGLISANRGPMPSRIDFQDTRLCRTSPYKGGDLTLSILLSRVSSDPKLAHILRFVEQAGGVLKKTVVLAPYAEVAELVASSLNDLADDKDSAPLFGAHMALSQDNKTLRSGFLLIAAAELDREQVWLVDSEVRVGTDSNSAVPLTCDHVLLAIELGSARSDAETLPAVADYWPHVEDFAGRADEGSWLTAKTWLSVLAQELYLSPDLTRSQAEQLYQGYVDRAVHRRDEARALAQLGPIDQTHADVRVLRNIDEAIRAL